MWKNVDKWIQEEQIFQFSLLHKCTQPLFYLIFMKSTLYISFHISISELTPLPHLYFVTTLFTHLPRS